MFVEILICHIDRIFEEIIAHFNEMKKKMLPEVHKRFSLAPAQTPQLSSLEMENASCLPRLDLNIIESELN